MVFAKEAIPDVIVNQIGIINGVDASKYKTYGEFLADLQFSFVEDKKDFSDLFEAQDKAAVALHKKGITGHLIDAKEIVIYDEGDIVKTKQTRIYNSDSELISDQYHRAKADGSNPELVKAVEQLLSNKPQETLTPTGKAEGAAEAVEKTPVVEIKADGADTALYTNSLSW